jgi:hypothetical protein
MNRPVALLLMLIAASTACTDNDARPECSFDSDCIPGQEICDLRTSTCIAFGPQGCKGDADCSGQQRCNVISGACVAPAGDMNTPDMRADMAPADMPGDMRADMNPPDLGPDMEEDMGGGDTTPPVLVTISPEGNTFLDDARPTFTVTYNEPLNPLSVSAFTVFLRDAANMDIPVQVTPSGRSFTVQPTVDLGPGNAYVLVLDRLISDEAGNRQTNAINTRYFTRFVEDPAHRALAERWAPVIYQDVHDTSDLNWRADLPVAIDFDGDLVSNNNRDRAFEPAYDSPAQVYYQVISSQTQHFISYALYYPVREDIDVTSGMRERYEHDFAGVLLIIDRASDTLLVAEGAHILDTDDRIVSYNRSGGPVKLGTNGVQRTFNPNTLEEDRRYPLYVVAGRHEACNWQDAQPMSPSLVCKHPGSGFEGGAASGVVLRPGEQGQRWDEASVEGNGARSMTYGIAPLQALFWTRRTDAGMDRLFDRTFGYTPAGGRASGPDMNSSLILPNRLDSDDPRSFGKSPFRWLPSLGKGNYGQWIIDPAYTTRERYSIEQSITWSLDYCDNFFLSIDPATAGAGCAP